MPLFEDFERADRVLTRALERPEHERAAYIAAECDGDEALRDRVLGLLAAATGGDERLEPGGALRGRALEEALAGDGETVVGRRIGPYRALEEIGRGGMSVVYLAERIDGAFEQQVALKLIAGGHGSGHAERRFLQERQILAALNHAHIARLLDGGTTEDGAPYLVMELVDGETIDRYCDANRLGVDERLRLFLVVCDAVAYAHRNLIVHRDLKPSNIQVTAEGVPKLLDFGIAKLLEPETWSGHETRTRLGERPMTPRYASPEQILGLPVSTATDVYALGLLLYELLCGRPAQEPESSRTRDIERAVCEQEPRRPSTVVTRPGPPAGTDDPATDPATDFAASLGLPPARLRRRLAGDLDNIVMMALRKEPERRYPSVSELADDIRRHLEERPVVARGDSLVYRTRKLLRRRAGTIIAAALVVLTLVGGLVATALQARRATAEARRAEEVSGFLVELLEDADPNRSQGEEVTVREVLDRAAARLGVELEGEPRVRGTMQALVGKVYAQLASFREADEQLERALETQRAALGADDPAVAETLELRASVQRTLGDWDRAEAMARESLALRLAAFGTDDERTARSLRELGLTLYRKGELEPARAALERGVAIQERAWGDANPDLATTLDAWARVAYEAGSLEEAEALARRAVAVRRTESAASRELASHLQVLSWVLVSRASPAQIAEADTLMREAIEIESQLLGADHVRVAMLKVDLAAIRERQGDLEGSEELSLESIASLESALGAEHPEVASGYNNLAVHYYRAGRWDEAVRYWQKSLDLRRRILEPDHPLIGTTEAYLGLGLHQAGDERAEAMYRSALDHLLVSRGPEHYQVGNLRNDFGRLFAEKGRYVEAEEELRAAYEILDRVYGDDDSRTDAARANLGWVLCAQGKFGEGERLLERAAERRKKHFGEGHYWLAEVDLMRAVCLARDGATSEAKRLAASATEQLAAAKPAGDPLLRFAEQVRRSL